MINKTFKTNDTANRYHKDNENLCQIIYQILAGCFNDDDADELTNEPVLNTILNKDGLASQPTLSKFFNRMDEDTLSNLKRFMSPFSANNLVCLATRAFKIGFVI